jgi:hypothetical protein
MDGCCMATVLYWQQLKTSTLFFCQEEHGTSCATMRQQQDRIYIYSMPSSQYCPWSLIFFLTRCENDIYYDEMFYCNLLWLWCMSLLSDGKNMVRPMTRLVCENYWLRSNTHHHIEHFCLRFYWFELLSRFIITIHYIILYYII